MRELFITSTKHKNTQNSKQPSPLSRTEAQKTQITHTAYIDEIESSTDSEEKQGKQINKPESISESDDEIQISFSEENISAEPKGIQAPKPRDRKTAFGNTTLLNENESPSKKLKTSLEKQNNLPLINQSQIVWQNAQSISHKTQNVFSIDLTVTDSDDEKEINAFQKQPSAPSQQQKTQISPSLGSNSYSIFSQNAPTQKKPFNDITNTALCSAAFSQENSTLIFLLARKGYADNYPHLYGNYAPSLNKSGNLETTHKRDCPETSAIFSYVCHNSNNKNIAFVVKNINPANLDIKLSKDWPNWYKNKFQQNKNKDLGCIFIFEFNSHSLPKNDEDCLRQIGKSLCLSKEDFPCGFMFSYGNKLSKIYSSDDAKNSHKDSINKILSDIIENYQKIVETSLKFSEIHPFCQAMEEDRQSYKNQFLPNQFVEVEKHYSDLLFKLQNFEKKCSFYSKNNDNAKNLLTEIIVYIHQTKNIISQLDEIKKEYVGNKEKEARLTTDWKKIQNDNKALNLIGSKLTKNQSTLCGTGWLKEHKFAVLTRMNQIETDQKMNLFLDKNKYCENLSLALEEDFSYYTSTLTKSNFICVL